MKKKNIIAVILLAILICTATLITQAMSPKKALTPTDYAIGTTYAKAVKDKKPMIALFYTDWCTYCLRFMPKYKMISEVYKDKYNFVMINVEDPNNQSLVKDYAIGGFPTIYIIDPQIDNRISISNTLYDDLKKLRVEFDRYLRIRSMINLEK